MRPGRRDSQHERTGNDCDERPTHVLHLLVKVDGGIVRAGS
jgi:hypothetical protein